MVQFRLLTSSWFNSSGLAKSRNLLISLRFPNLMEYRVFFKVFLCDIVIFFGACCNVSLFASESIYLSPLFLLVNWAKGLAIMFILTKNQLLPTLILCAVFFVSISLIFALIFISSCHQQNLVCLCFSKFLVAS